MQDKTRHSSARRFRGLPRSWRRLWIALLAVAGGLAVAGFTAAPSGVTGPASAAGGQPARAPRAAASAVQAHASSGGARAGSAVPAVPWGQCAASWDMPPGWLCAMYRVPRDYADPSAGTVSLAVAKLPAADPAGRRGSVFFNPGGPGEPGLKHAAGWERYVGPSVRQEYDLVTWDPRGTGLSEPLLECLSAEESDRARGLPEAVLTDPEMEANLKATAAIAYGCAQQQLTRFVTTMDNVRDLDTLRQAVGDQKLSFVGISYGTVIGALYANVFPDRYRALVLHGVVDSTTWFQPSFAFTTDDAVQKQKTLNAALHACDGVPANCALAPNAAPKYAQLLDRVRALALASGNSQQFAGLWRYSSALVETPNIVQPREAARVLQRCYQQIVVGHATSCPELTAAARQPAPPETWASPGDLFSNDVRDATICSDAGPVPDRWIAAAHQADQVARVFGVASVLDRSMCASWSAFGDRYTGGWDHGQAPILLLNQQWDQATPLAWAQTMTRRLGDAHLVTISGWGHGEETRCSTSAVASYLLTGALPATSFCGDGRALALSAPPAAAVAPGAFTLSSTRVVVYTGTDGAVWIEQVGSPIPARSLGGRLVSAPSPVSAGGTRIVFGEGTDHALWEKAGNGPWTSLGGRLTSKPGAAVSGAPSAPSATVYRVYVRGADGAVWARNHTAAGWGGWHLAGGRVLAGTGPSAAAAGGSFFVLVAGTNRELFIAQNGGAFAAAGGVTNSSPALVNAPSSGSLVGFAQGTNRAGFFHRFLPTTPAWTSMGGILTTGMGGSATDTNWYAYALGTDNEVWEHTGTGGATGPWRRVTP